MLRDIQPQNWFARASTKLVIATAGLACAPALAQRIDNWSDFQGYCNSQGADAVKASGGRGPHCAPRAPGGAGTAGGGGHSATQQMGLQIWEGLLQGLISGSGPNAEQERLRREAEQARKIEAQKKEIERLEREAREKDEARARLLTNMRGLDSSSGSQLQFRLSDSPAPAAGVPLSPFPQSVPPSSAGLQFRFGDEAPGAGSALEQLQRAAGSGGEAVRASSREAAADNASAVFDRVGPGTTAGVAAPKLPPSSAARGLLAKLEVNQASQQRLKREIDELKQDPNPTPEKQAALRQKENEIQRLEEEKQFLDLSITEEAAAAPPQ